MYIIPGQMEIQKKLQPNATVRDDGLSISRNDVADSEQEVADWAKGFQ